MIATLAYDDLGRRISLTRGNGVATFYEHDPLSRLDALRLEFAGTARDLTLGFGTRPAGAASSAARRARFFEQYRQIDRPRAGA